MIYDFGSSHGLGHNLIQDKILLDSQNDYRNLRKYLGASS